MKKVTLLASFCLCLSAMATPSKVFRCKVESDKFEEYAVEFDLTNKKAMFFNGDNWSVLSRNEDGDNILQSYESYLGESDGDSVEARFDVSSGVFQRHEVLFSENGLEHQFLLDCNLGE